jgi:two-component system, OmpR family, response regulator
MTPVSVLVVDDMADTARTTADVLTLLGFDARSAVTPLDAIREAAADPPDAVLLDLGMPGLSGYDLARHLGGEGPERPLLVALTGIQGSESEARAAGFDLHVLKPADPVQLADLLRAAVDRRTDLTAAPGTAS